MNSSAPHKSAGSGFGPPNGGPRRGVAQERAPQIGFDRYVQLTWCKVALDVAIAEKSLDELRGEVATSLPGVQSQRKTVDILKRLWINPFPTTTDFVLRGRSLYRIFGAASALPLSWGSALATYPFFGRTSEIAGRLLTLQGDCSIKEIQRRMAEAYGDRNGIDRAVARILQSQSDWGTLQRVGEDKRIVRLAPIAVDNDQLAGWLIEAAVRYAGKPVSVLSLQSLPVLFPFTLMRPLAYVVSNSPNLSLQSEGPSNQFVALRH